MAFYSEANLKGIEGKHCFSVTDRYVIGYLDSLSFSDPTIFTYCPINHPEWFVHPVPSDFKKKSDQKSLQLRLNSGEQINKCTQCLKLYVQKHNHCSGIVTPVLSNSHAFVQVYHLL